MDDRHYSAPGAVPLVRGVNRPGPNWMRAEHTDQPRLRGTPGGTSGEVTGGRLVRSTGYQARSSWPMLDAPDAVSQVIGATLLRQH